MVVGSWPHCLQKAAELLDVVLAAAETEGAETRRIDLYDLTSISTRGAYSKNPAFETVTDAPEDDITALYPEIIRADVPVVRLLDGRVRDVQKLAHGTSLISLECL